jgi:hypothetical protein
MKLLVGLVLICSTAFAEVTARGSFDAGKDVAFNAAMKAIDAKEWKLRNASYPRGAIWFVPAGEIDQADFEAAALIAPAPSGSDVQVILRFLKKEPSQHDADRILAQLLKSMAGKKAAQLDDTVVKKSVLERAASEAVIRDSDLSSAFDRTLAVAKSLGRVVRSDRATSEIIYISTNSANETNGARISVGLKLVDQGGDVRVSARFWTVNGQKIYDSSLTDITFTELREQLRAN